MVEPFEARRTVKGAFSPTAPISRRDLFAGRTTQMMALVDGVDEPGQHLILFGERGVGKTSLATVTKDVIGSYTFAVKVNCQSGDTFSGIWKRVFNEVSFVQSREGVGFAAGTTTANVPLGQLLGLPDVLTSDEVRAALRVVTESQPIVIFIDEFDTVRNSEVQQQFADCIKAMSDQLVPATIVLVGVAENVEDLISEHASVERALAQINMPRMSNLELGQIVINGLASINMEISDVALGRITRLSQGLPHYTHLLGQQAALEAFAEEQLTVTPDHVDRAITNAVGRSQESIASTYYSATYSARENLYKQVLLACAVAESDDRGFFSAAAVRESLSNLLDRPMEIPQFAMHLNAFSTDRGPVLKKAGARRKFRYRFANPLVQPYVLMRGIQDGLITTSMLDRH